MSQKQMKDVQSEGKIIAQVEVELFDNMDEAESALGEETCLKYINRSNVITLMDNKRREATGTGGTGVRALMAKVKGNPELLAKLKELVGEV